MPSVHSIVYTAFTVLTFPARLVTWWLYYIPRSNRPNHAWSWKTAVTMKVTNLFMRYLVTTKHRTPKSLEPGEDGDRFMVLNPQKTIGETESPVYKGTLTSIPAVQPVPIGAVWYPAAPIQPPRKLIIHFHPSAYVLFGPRPKEGFSWGIDNLGKLSGWPALSIQYRLSLDADKTFPAAIQDGITAYVYALETLKIPPSQIVLSGESAGGNLVLAMLRYIATENQALPLPRSALLWSPWVDMTEQGIIGPMNSPNLNSDFIKEDLARWAVSSYIPPGWSASNGYLSPLGSEYKSTVPLYIETGTAEVLYDTIIEFARNMKDMGTEIELHEAPNAPHVVFSNGAQMGMPEVAIDGHARATRFITRTGPPPQ